MNTTITRLSTFCLTLGLCLGVWTSDANAISINGNEYTKFLSAQSDQYFGYWLDERKFYTYFEEYNQAIDFNSVDYVADEVSGFDFSQVYAMGTTERKRWDSSLSGGVVNLQDSQGHILLEGDYVSHGELDSTRHMGTAGQLDMTGLFSVTGGQLYDLGLVDGLIYVELLFDNVRVIDRNRDIAALDGTINFYAASLNGGPEGPGGPGGPGTEIPEPASMLLLGSSLCGALRLRKKAKG